MVRLFPLYKEYNKIFISLKAYLSPQIFQIPVQYEEHKRRLYFNKQNT